MSDPKCKIINLDEGGSVECTYNPNTISIDKSVPWNKHKRPKGNTPMLEFTNAENRTLSVEFFFDTYEDKADVYKVGGVEALTSFTLIRKNASKDEDKRPPLVQLEWGAFPKFKGVIESLSTKYTMFLPNGTPVRATCSVKMKEADTVNAKVRKKGGDSGGDSGGE